MSTDQSIESTQKELLNKFSPKVILVNHHKKLPVDTSCANLAIKYNMIYISAYQVIRKHIIENTEYGKKLTAGQKQKGIDSSLKVRDEFQEAQYSPVHFDLPTVMSLLKDTINEKRTNQKFVLLEGLCNAQKLSDVDDQMQLRFMDELFNIEHIIGEVAAVIAMQYHHDPLYIGEDEIEYEKFPEPVQVEEKKKPEGEEGEEEAEPEAAAEEEGDGGEPKAPAFKPEDF